MIKNLLLLSFLCCVIFSCHSNNTQNDNATSSEKNDKKISKRDISINKNNAYSDLFFDNAYMENYIRQNAVPDSLVQRLRSFYNARNYQFAWFTSKGLTEQALGFWNLRNYISYGGDTIKNKTLKQTMNKLVQDDSLQVTVDSSSINTELALTVDFIQYLLGKYEKGYVKRKEMERFVPLKKEDAVAVADSLVNKKHKDDKYFDDVNENYAALKKELANYLQIVKSGGWPVVQGDASGFKKGKSSTEIAVLKKRLAISGDMAAADTSQAFDDTLSNGIKHYQQRLGLTQDGVVSKSFLQAVNITAQQRLQQILINLNRMRWMPNEPSGQLILVNLPEFELHVFENKKKAFDMNVVVGKEGHNTVLFTGKLSTVVFSPYWNLPSSIVKKEVLPKMNANPDYLASQHMEVTGNSGGLPVIRQLPGEWNSLGKVKFLFPNSYNIYFHDTNAKGLFKNDKRAYSHGCIRLSEPEKMAEYLLKDQQQWTPDKIEEAMNSGDQQFVNITHPVPVFITYYTAWVDENGLLNFRDDIYGRDSTVAQMMF